MLWFMPLRYGDYAYSTKSIVFDQCYMRLRLPKLLLDYTFVCAFARNQSRAKLR